MRLQKNMLIRQMEAYQIIPGKKIRIQPQPDKVMLTVFLDQYGTLLFDSPAMGNQLFKWTTIIRMHFA